MVISPSSKVPFRLLEALAFIVFWVLAIVFFQNVFNHDYSITDSHMFIRIEEALQQKGFFATLSERVNSEGRYRPMFWTPVILFTQVFGSNIFFSKIYYIVLWGLSSFFLYRIALKVLVSKWFAFIFSIMTLVGPQIIGAYFCGAAESFGIFFVSLGTLLCLANGPYRFFSKTAGVLVLIMACFTKETFMVVMPSILFFIVYLEYLRGDKSFFEHIKNNILWFAPIGLACLYIVYYIFAKGIEGGSYAGLGGSNMSTFSKLAKSYKGMTHYVIKYFAITSLLVAIISLIINQRQSKYATKKSFWVFGLGILAALLLVLPQLYVYSKSGLYQRYFLPISMGFSILFLMSTFLFEKASNNKLFKYAIIGLSFFMVGQEYNKSVRYGVNDFYHKSRNISKAINAIESKVTDKNANILLVGDPALDYELLNNSLPSYFMIKKKYKNLKVLLIEHNNYKFPYLKALKGSYSIKHAEKIVVRDDDVKYDAVFIMPETFWHKTGIDYEAEYDTFNKQGEKYLNFDKENHGGFIVYTNPQEEQLSKEPVLKKITDDKTTRLSFVAPGKNTNKSTFYWINTVNGITYSKVENNEFVINKHAKSLEITGWAIDTPNKVTPEEVYVKIGQREYKCELGRPTPWVANNYGSQYANAGFKVVIPIADMPNVQGKFPIQCTILNKNKEKYVNSNPLTKDKELFINLL